MILQALADEDATVTQGKIRHFENSLIHLTKHRIAQVHLILTQLIPSEAAQLMRDVAIGSLLDSDQQNSVKIYTEWIVHRLNARFKTELLDADHP